MNKLWILFGFLSALFAALVAIFGKIGVKDIDTTLATTIRALIMAIFLIIISLSLNKFSFLNQINSKALIFIILSGISGALSWLAYFFALKLGPAKGVAVLDRFSVVLVIILAGLFLGEIITIKNWVGIILITLGLLLFIF
ncbi:MAG: EamA family transporter [Patescibacteria group bacterium]|nr:EamA family transporter [Patescibacteria group bacterium]MCX7589322.1 EamA family transporter [Patescibacteria group bacterium]MDW8279663.1 EamA family transporter [bacterium]